MTRLAIDDIKVGDSHSERVEFDPETTERFLRLSRDTAGIHIDEQFSREHGFDALVVHGFLLSLHFSRILGMQLPGENTVIGTIDLKFHDPVYVGDTATFTATVTRILKPLGTVVLELLVTKQDGTKCVEGKTSCVFKAAHDLQTARSRTP